MPFAVYHIPTQSYLHTVVNIHGFNAPDEEVAFFKGGCQVERVDSNVVIFIRWTEKSVEDMLYWPYNSFKDAKKSIHKHVLPPNKFILESTNQFYSDIVEAEFDIIEVD